MNTADALDTLNNSQPTNEKYKPLIENFGVLGTIQYLEQFDNGGNGDYTKEKYEHPDQPLAEILAQLEYMNS